MSKNRSCDIARENVRFKGDQPVSKMEAAFPSVGKGRLLGYWSGRTRKVEGGPDGHCRLKTAEINLTSVGGEGKIEENGVVL